MPSLTREIPHGSDMAKKILTEIMLRRRIHERGVADKYDRWTKAEEETLAYMHERDVDRLRKTKREGGMPEYTTIKIPYTYAVLMAAHTYFTSVFMGRNPVFQYSGRHGETSMQVMAIEALIDYQLLAGNMLPSLYSWLYDAGKYGLGVVGCYWDDRYDYVTSIKQESIIDPFTQQPGPAQNVQVTERRKTYSGNRLYNIQPWDFIWDTRVPVMQFQEGEFCGVRRTLSWNEVKRRQAAGYYMSSIAEIKGKTNNLEGAAVGSSELHRPESSDPSTWMQDPGSEILSSLHPANVNTFEICIELIPSEWGLGGSPHPEKWMFTCTSDYSVLMGAQPHGAYHCKYPFQVLTLEAEAYGIVPRGMPETLEPIQQTIDWLVNSHFYNVRAALNNKFVVDPAKVVMKDLLDPKPGGIIRMRPEAFGTDPKLAVHQLQTVDVTRSHLQDLQMMYGMGERTMGVNDQIMGMLSTGGRKTATEVRTSTSFGVNRLKTTAEFFSASGFSPLSLMMLQNTQQYYDEVQKFKIVGDLAMTAGASFMMVDPQSIQGAYDFVPVDGTLPIDRFAQVQMWQQLLTQMRAVPEVALQYDFGRMFEWVAQLGGMRNLGQFKVQIMDPNLLLQAKMAGNVVPIGQGKPKGKNGAPGSPGPAQPSAPQLPGMGALT
jgi:hypothetical protein